MVRYYCNTCGREVGDLYTLVDLTSALSSGNRPEWHDAGFRVDHVCKTCVAAIQAFIKTLALGTERFAEGSGA